MVRDGWISLSFCECQYAEEKTRKREVGWDLIWFQMFAESCYTRLWRHEVWKNVVLDLRKLNLSPCYSKCGPSASLVVRNAESQLAPDLLNQSLCSNTAITAHVKAGDPLLQIGHPQPWMNIKSFRELLKVLPNGPHPNSFKQEPLRVGSGHQ